jgi:uncharacterized cupredoxin-like copper-binding protein
MIRKSFILIILSVTISYAQFLGPKISSQQLEHDFGNIEYGQKVTHYFVLTNNGDDNLLIQRVRASCGCTVAKPEKDKLAPGESTKLKVEFNSAGRKGKQEKTITVSTNDPKTPELRLKIKGMILPSVAAGEKNPDIFFRETNHDFGNVKEGKTVEYTFKFTNKGSAPLEIKKVRTSCGCTAALLSSKKLDPGSEGTLKVELDTKNRSGKMSRTITVESNDVKEPSKVLTIFANIEK